MSDLGTFFKHRNNPDYASLGASGAISAVLFALVVYFPEMSLFIIPIPVPIPAPLFAVGYVAYTWWSAKQARGRINHDAHLGGALFGVLFVMLTDPDGLRGPAAARSSADAAPADAEPSRACRALQELRTVALFRAHPGRRGGYTRDSQC